MDIGDELFLNCLIEKYEENGLAKLGLMDELKVYFQEGFDFRRLFFSFVEARHRSPERFEDLRSLFRYGAPRYVRNHSDLLDVVDVCVERVQEDWSLWLLLTLQGKLEHLDLSYLIFHKKSRGLLLDLAFHAIETHNFEKGEPLFTLLTEIMLHHRQVGEDMLLAGKPFRELMNTFNIPHKYFTRATACDWVYNPVDKCVAQFFLALNTYFEGHEKSLAFRVFRLGHKHYTIMTMLVKYVYFHMCRAFNFRKWADSVPTLLVFIADILEIQADALMKLYKTQPEDLDNLIDAALDDYRHFRGFLVNICALARNPFFYKVYPCETDFKKSILIITSFCRLVGSAGSEYEQRLLSGEFTGDPAFYANRPRPEKLREKVRDQMEKEKAEKDAERIKKKTETARARYEVQKSEDPEPPFEETLRGLQELDDIFEFDKIPASTWTIDQLRKWFPRLEIREDGTVDSFETYEHKPEQEW